jgi:hypothetical protein
VPPYSKYFDMDKYIPLKVDTDKEMGQTQTLLLDLWNHTEITGVTVNDNGFVITGSIETVQFKKIGIVTPFITEEDDVAFFITAMGKINDIMQALAFDLENNMLPVHESKDTLKALNITVESSKMTEEEIINKMIEKLVDKGAVVMIPDDSKPTGITDGKDKEDTKTTLHKGNGSIDSHNMPEAIPAEEEVVKRKSTKKPEKSTLASDKNFPDLSKEVPEPVTNEERFIPDGGSMEHLEYSKNLGMAGDLNEVEPDIIEEEENNIDDN